jgi:NTP pyrophosphatase (non-canonical NTP hydrolase)
MSTLSRLAAEWAVRSFGAAHVSNRPLRALRIVEEAIELAQALGVPKGKIDLCTENVYKRPVGTMAQELGGVLLTTNILCASCGFEPDRMLEMELGRVLAKPPEHFAKRNQDKLDLGLDVDPTHGLRERTLT